MRLPAAAVLLSSLLFAQTDLPVSGAAVPEMAAFDSVMTSLITKYKLPGGSLAVVDRGRLVLARGYGYADREANVGVQPFSLFRIASLSKPVTSLGVLKLVQDGKLRLDAKLTEILPDLQPPPGQTLDPRYRNVTIEQLLWHSYGSDNARNGGDPVFRLADAQRVFLGAPHSIANVARFGLGLPLNSEPGARYAYSNLGYSFLGRVIEKVSGKSYENYIREDVLAPMAISTMRVGRTLQSQRYTDEVKYYDYEGAPARASVIAGVSGNLPRPYGGGFLVELADSWGGWVASAVDLVRFVTSIDGRRGAPAFLNETTYRTMLARPPHQPAGASYYAMAWNTRPVETRFTYFHSGSLPGTRTYLASFQNGRAYAVLFNTRPRESDLAVAEGANDTFMEEVDRELGAAFGRVTRWPETDQFPQFARETLNTSAETLTFQHQAGAADPAPQTLSFTSSGGSVYATATVAPGAPWLRLDRNGGFAPTSIRVTANPAGLAPGDYNATINLVAPDARNSPRAIRVTLRVFAEVMVKNGASLAPGPVAPGSLAVAEGPEFAEDAALKLGDTDVPVAGRSANRLIFVVPADTPAGDATLTIRTGGAELRGAVKISALAPGLFSADRTGLGAAQGVVVTMAEDGSETTAPLADCPEGGACAALPIDAAPGARIRLAATGVRGHAELAGMSAKIGDLDVEIVSATATEEPGRDTITLKLPAELAGRGEVDVVVTGGGNVSNAVKINVR